MSLKYLEDCLDREERYIQKEKLRTGGRKKPELATEAKAREAGLHGERLALAEGIFQWVQEFSATEQYCRLLIIAQHRCTNMIKIPLGGWGHNGHYETSGGRWSGVSIVEDKSLHYWAGRKWLGINSSLRIATPEELASKLCHGYLDKFAQALRSEKVYEIIAQANLIYAEAKK
ncbi:MAG: hypothetical protein HY438_03275 [DPANN group archaeon]|nr:hypothetical protein [DPANN group archaeon]